MTDEQIIEQAAKAIAAHYEFPSEDFWEKSHFTPIFSEEAKYHFKVVKFGICVGLSDDAIKDLSAKNCFLKMRSLEWSDWVNQPYLNEEWNMFSEVYYKGAEITLNLVRDAAKEGSFKLRSVF